MTRAPLRSALGLLLAGVMLLAAGCVTADPSQPAARVAGQVKERTGQEVAWQRDQESRREAAARVRAMLADGLTLPEALAIGLAANRRIQGLYHELGLAQAGLAQAGLLKNPHLAFSYKDIPSDGYIIELEVVENIMSLFMMPLRQGLAESRLAAAEAMVAGEVLIHLHRVRQAYLALQTAQGGFKIATAMADASQAAWEMADRMRQAGNITRLELLVRRDLRDQDRLALARASLAVADAREGLNRVLGLWGPGLDYSVPPEIPPVPEAGLDLDGLERRAVGASLDLAQARAAVEAEARQSGITDVESWLPDLGVGVALEREDDGTWLRGPALELALPIFDPGFAKRGAARSRLARAWEEYTALAVDLRSRARGAARRLGAAREMAVYYQTSWLPLRREMTRQAQLRYNGMFLSLFDLLDFKRRELAAELAYALALREYWEARSAAETLLAGRMVEAGPVSGPAMPDGGGMGGGGH